MTLIDRIIQGSQGLIRMPRHQIARRLKPEHHSLEILQNVVVHFSRETRLFDRARLQSDGLRLLLFAHIQRKNYSLGPRLLEARHAHQYRHARTIFAEEFLLEWLQTSNPFYPFDPLFVGGSATPAASAPSSAGGSKRDPHGCIPACQGMRHWTPGSGLLISTMYIPTMFASIMRRIFASRTRRSP